MVAEINIRTLDINDVEYLVRLISEQDSVYLKYFRPFNFTLKSFIEILGVAKRDKYWVIEYHKKIVGFCMLRGFDAGYLRPSFGVFIAQTMQGKGLATFALEFVKDWCITNDVGSIMLKVSPENIVATRIYLKAGFEPVGRCVVTDHNIYEWQSR